jgi:membrane associated rhomboid family serine protease
LRSRFPRVTFALIAANVAAFLYELSLVGPGLLTGGGSLDAVADAGALVPAFVTGRGEYWRLLTGAFLHGSAIHLAVNMYSLFALGQFVEGGAGAARMAVIYGVALLVSGLSVVYFAGPYDVTVGASGAIFGLFGALFAMGFRLGRPGMKLVQQNIGILLINLVFTFAVPGISAAAHVGGLISGFVVGYLIYRPQQLQAI